MAVADPYLDAFRYDLAAVIGCPVRDVGMLPDEDHLESGGYHCGLNDLVSIGRFHFPRTANIGSSTEDYSARQERDRRAIDQRAAAVDTPDDWPNGGRAAWIRWNNMIVAQLQAGDPALAALRGINFTPDGELRRRYDTLHAEAGVIPSTDTVRWHTHLEFWRDLLGSVACRRALARLLQLARAAIEGRPVPPEGEDEMGATYIGGVIDEWDPEVLSPQTTNVPVGIVRGGAADPRPGWLDIVNDTFGVPYALRVMASTGYGGFQAVKMNLVKPEAGTVYDGGLLVLKSGWRAWVELPKDTVLLSIARQGIGANGVPMWPSREFPAYRGSLGFAIERGAVGA